ncbi:hypothetical protein HZC34_05250 [Candidatus Saganbacteria bacterium]|nr:hypothetical protein [Candidatus Saganbacteria bacterium]
MAQIFSGIPGIIFTSAIVVLSWGYLVFNGDISIIWPMFGVANQLLATTALAIGTTIIIKNKWYGLITFFPMLFMLATTISAGVINILDNYIPQHSFNGNLNALLSFIMMALVFFVVIDTTVKMFFYLYKTNPREKAFKEKDEALELDI